MLLPASTKDQIRALNETLGLTWVETLLRDDGLKTDCLDESPNREKISEQAKILGIPADVIVAVDRVQPVGDSRGDCKSLRN